MSTKQLSACAGSEGWSTDALFGNRLNRTGISHRPATTELPVDQITEKSDWHHIRVCTVAKANLLDLRYPSVRNSATEVLPAEQHLAASQVPIRIPVSDCD